MLKKVLALLVLTAVTPTVWAVSYDQNITAIFGSGNPDTGWTTDSGTGITLGLRGKDRGPSASTANVNGVYSFAAGYDAGVPPKSTWNWEFSINSGTAPLSTYNYFVGIDLDPSQGVNYTYVNALTFWTDNSYGNSATLNGQGTEGTSALAAANFIAQQSQNLIFGPAGGNPLLDATYNYDLFAVAAGDDATGARLADVNIQVVVGAGGSRVPEAGSTAAMLGLGLLGLAAMRKVKATA